MTREPDTLTSELADILERILPAEGKEDWRYSFTGERRLNISLRVSEELYAHARAVLAKAKIEP